MNHPKLPCMASSQFRIVMYRLLESSTLEGIRFLLLHTLQSAFPARLRTALPIQPQNHAALFRTGVKPGHCSNKNNWRTI